jgi:hypothetical protein
MPGAGKDLDFPRDDLAECNRTGTGLCTFPEITLGGFRLPISATNADFFLDRAVGLVRASKND